jgi:hypothetical protein
MKVVLPILKSGRSTPNASGSIGLRHYIGTFASSYDVYNHIRNAHRIHISLPSGDMDRNYSHSDDEQSIPELFDYFSDPLENEPQSQVYSTNSPQTAGRQPSNDFQSSSSFDFL